MADPVIPPFDPGVPTGGYSTNLLSTLTTEQQYLRTPLFVGWQSGHADDVRGSGATPPRMKVELTPTQLMQGFDRLNRGDYLRFRNLFIAAGLVSKEADPVDVRNTYAQVIDQVSTMQGEGINLSPMGFVKNLIRQNGLDPSEIGSDEDYAASTGFTGSKTTTSRNVTDIDEGEAWASLQNTLSSMLGRDPSDQETRDFTYRMSQLAARNPSISRTVTQYKDGDATSSSTRTTPGFTAADLAHAAYDDAQSDPGYAEFRSGSYYFNAAMSALGAIGG